MCVLHAGDVQVAFVEVLDEVGLDDTNGLMHHRLWSATAWKCGNRLGFFHHMEGGKMTGVLLPSGSTVEDNWGSPNQWQRGER